MAKAGKLIPLYRRPTVKGLKVQVKEFQDGYQAAKGEAAALQRQLETLQKGYDDLREQKNKAWEVAGRWEKQAEKLERDNGNLAQELGEMSRDKDRTIEKLAGQLNRCMGWIAAKMEDHPAEEAKPTYTDKMPASEADYDRFRNGRPMSGDGMAPRPQPAWRKALGL